MTKLREFRPISNREKPIMVDPDNYELIKDEVKVGKITELSVDDASLVLPHLECDMDCASVMTSGIVLSSDSYNYGVYGQDQKLYALEVVRIPENGGFPTGSKNDSKVNRYVIGISEKDRQIKAYDVTERYSNPITDQVGNHHDTFESLFHKYGLDKE